MNCESVPGKTGSLSVSSYSSHSMMAIHYVPLSLHSMMALHYVPLSLHSMMAIHYVPLSLRVSGCYTRSLNGTMMRTCAGIVGQAWWPEPIAH